MNIVKLLAVADSCSAQSKSISDTCKTLRKLAANWPRGAILIHLVDSGVYLYDKHPEEGGKRIEAFNIPCDSVTGLEP